MRNRSRSLVGFLSLIFLFKIVFSGLVGLGDDEAYYWDWSRHLDWSYFDHPPMIAYLIRFSTMLFGTSEWAVRLPAVLSHVLGGYFLFSLTTSIFARRTAWFALLFYLLVPGMSLGSFLSVPDAPMTVAWLGGAWFLYKQLYPGKGTYPSVLAWLIFGMILGFGILSKYTLVLFAFGALIWILQTRAKWFLRSGPWLAMFIAFCLVLPILYWNLVHQWPSVRFHLSDRQSGGLSWIRWGQFWGSQVAVLTPLVFVLVGWAFVKGAMEACKGSKENTGWRFLFLINAPVLFLFFVQSLFAEFKPHWALPGYVLLFPGAAQALLELIKSSVSRWAFTVFGWGVLGLANLFFYTQLLYPLIPKLPRALGSSMVWEQRWDATNDLYGWDIVGQKVLQLRDQQRASGKSVFLSSYRYQLVAQLAFATQERVYRLFPERDQYMIWQKDVASLQGSSAIFVVDQRYFHTPNEYQQFESCEDEIIVKTYRFEVEAHTFSIWVCHGFRGFKPDPR